MSATKLSAQFILNSNILADYYNVFIKKNIIINSGAIFQEIMGLEKVSTSTRKNIRPL
jgi:hypothetical protein